MMEAVLRLILLPGELIADRFHVSKEENRDLVRMLINGLFWIFVAIIGLAIWTSTLSIYQ
ncbi:hypothetical protein [Chelativorans sp. J32]|uniref:hypothetical protein n=1 Tax=Chelativorans sp. J32 TaxID=935840 RepID=UPI00048606DC|nr:hypothetical protein [Chelativorans sp. J32]